MNVAVMHILSKLSLLFLLLSIYFIWKILLKNKATKKEKNIFKTKWTFLFLVIIILLTGTPSFLNNQIDKYYLKGKSLKNSFQYYYLEKENTYFIPGNDQGFIIVSKDTINYVVNARKEKSIWNFEQTYPTNTNTKENIYSIELYKGIETTLMIIEVNSQIVPSNTITDSLDTTFHQIKPNIYYASFKSLPSNYELVIYDQKITLDQFNKKNSR